MLISDYPVKYWTDFDETFTEYVDDYVLCLHLIIAIFHILSALKRKKCKHTEISTPGDLDSHSAGEYVR